MIGLCRSVAIGGALVLVGVLAGCADSGPTTSLQITQDIGSSFWTRDQFLPLNPTIPSQASIQEAQRLFP